MIFLKKGREIFTGTLIFSSDPVFLVFDLIYIGTENERILYSPTPYLAKKVNAAYYQMQEN
jgi:hypothetical protein